MQFSEAAASQAIKKALCFTPCVLSVFIKAIALHRLHFILLFYFFFFKDLLLLGLPGPTVHFRHHS